MESKKTDLPRLLITGGREWTDKTIIENAFKSLNKKFLLIHGTAAGADTICGQVAKELDWDIWEFKPDWTLGRAGGVIRNSDMLFQGQPELVFAFHPDLSSSKGTKNMVTQVQEFGLPVTWYDATNQIVILPAQIKDKKLTKNLVEFKPNIYIGNRSARYWSKINAYRFDIVISTTNFGPYFEEKNVTFVNLDSEDPISWKIEVNRLQKKMEKSKILVYFGDNSKKEYFLSIMTI